MGVPFFFYFCRVKCYKIVPLVVVLYPGQVYQVFNIPDYNQINSTIRSSTSQRALEVFDD